MNLETKDLKVLLNKNEILKGIDIELGNKEFIGVIGPNGSGKSTILKTIYKLINKNVGQYT